MLLILPYCLCVPAGYIVEPAYWLSRYDNNTYESQQKPTSFNSLMSKNNMADKLIWEVAAHKPS
jgi:hypothetical protein